MTSLERELRQNARIIDALTDAQKTELVSAARFAYILGAFPGEQQPDDPDPTDRLEKALEPFAEVMV